jgi:hypothetical protein
LSNAIESAANAVDRTVEAFIDAYVFDDGHGFRFIPNQDEDLLIRDAVARLLKDEEFGREFFNWQLLVRASKLSSASGQ